MLSIEYLRQIQNELKRYLGQKYNISEDQIICESFLKCKFYINVYYDKGKASKVKDYFVFERNNEKKIVHIMIEYRRFDGHRLGIYAVVTKVE